MRYLSTYRKTGPEEKEEEYPLRVNFGVPFVVSVCKSDSAFNLDTRNCPGRGDVVLAHLRALCLPYGAAICYCCAKDPLSFRNLDLLYRYCLHRVYDFKFDKPLTLQPPDSVFVPAGWDTEEEVEQFAKATVAGNLETPLVALLPQPPAEEVGVSEEKETVLSAMDTFLEGLLEKDADLLLKEGAAPAAAGRAPVIEAAVAAREVAPASLETARARRLTARAAPEAAGGRPPLTARRTQEQATEESESLRQFFAKLLAKPAHSRQGSGAGGSMGEPEKSKSGAMQPGAQ